MKDKKKEDFKDIPIGKKKQEFVRWLLRKGCSLNEARLICYKKFYHGDPFSKDSQDY